MDLVATRKESLMMTIEEKLDRLTGIVESLAGTIVAHDNQLEVLIQVAEKHSAQIAGLERQWQAYINTLPRH
jgi:hypothetical protein